MMKNNELEIRNTIVKISYSRI